MILDKKMYFIFLCVCFLNKLDSLDKQCNENNILIWTQNRFLITRDFRYKDADSKTNCTQKICIFFE